MIKCILVKIDNSFSVVELPDDNTFNDEVYKLLDCTCWEGVTNIFGYYMLLDENAKISNEPKIINILATTIYSGFPNDYILGDVLISKIGIDSDGETNLVSLSDEDIVKLTKALEEVLYYWEND